MTVGIVIGGLIAIVSSLITAIVNNYLASQSLMVQGLPYSSGSS